MTQTSLEIIAPYLAMHIVSTAVYSSIFFFVCKWLFIRDQPSDTLKKYAAKVLIKAIVLFDVLDLLAQIYLFFNGDIG